MGYGNSKKYKSYISIKENRKNVIYKYFYQAHLNVCKKKSGSFILGEGVVFTFLKF